MALSIEICNLLTTDETEILTLALVYTKRMLGDFHDCLDDVLDLFHPEDLEIARQRLQAGG